MFVNQKLRQDLAEKLLAAKNRLKLVDDKRSTYYEKADNIAQKYSSAVFIAKSK